MTEPTWPPAAAHVIAELRTDLGRTRAELKSLHERMAVLAHRLDAVDPTPGEIERLQALLASERARVDSLLASTSWRITAPARLAIAAVRRLRGR